MLLTLGSGLRSLPKDPCVSPNAWRGLADTLDVLIEVSPARAGRVAGSRASDRESERDAGAGVTPASCPGRARIGVGQADEEARYWVAAAANQCRDVLSNPLAALERSGLSPADTPPELRAVSAEAAALAQQCEALAEVDYDFLYDTSRHLLAIGFNVADHRREGSFYDLLASEARLVSFVAIAQGDLPQQHGLLLGRRLTSWRGDFR